MPRFIKDGPFVPDKLVQELEEDRVVLFCGAGISMGAGLPDFRGLVEHCYTELGAAMPTKKSGDWSWLDRMLGSLEVDFPGEMRTKVVECLNVAPRDTAMHEAILKLARLRGPTGGYRLVTTNFDHLFEVATPGMVLGQAIHSGPVLPIPRNDLRASWRSLVYLHGRLDLIGDNNDHLVLTSADFGRAYLTDGWAARFVARLFSEFTVLFIGYSLNDPVLRYMTDAFAAEEASSRNGRKRAPAYLFVPHSGHTPPDPKIWRTRRIEPIFYRAAYSHRALKNTLVEWAIAREDYQTSIRQIVQRNGPRLPSALEPSGVENLIWAICDRPNDSAHGAREFARLDPPAPLDWLAVFERRDADTNKVFQADLEEAKKEGRPSPPLPAYHIESLFTLSADNSGTPGVSEQGLALIPWIVHYLEDRALTDWMIEKINASRRPHQHLRRAIRRRLNTGSALAPGYAAFWRAVSCEGDWMVSHAATVAFYDLRQAIATERHAGWFDQELRSALRPRLKLTPRFATTGSIANPQNLTAIANAEAKFSADHIFTVIDRIDRTPDPDRYWADRLETLTYLLRQALDLYAAVGGADADSDPTVFQRPSIQPHAQNRHHAEWTRLYDLIWRGWTRIDATSASESRYWIDRWRRVSYPGFRRLVLATVCHSPHFTPDEKLDVLLNG